MDDRCELVGYLHACSKTGDYLIELIKEGLNYITSIRLVGTWVP